MCGAWTLIVGGDWLACSLARSLARSPTIHHRHRHSTAPQILMERPGDVVVQVKFTLLLLPSGTAKVTGLSFPTEAIASDKVRACLRGYVRGLLGG